MHAHTHSMHTCRNTHTHTHAQIQTLALSLTHTHKPTLLQTCTLTFWHTHKHTRITVGWLVWWGPPGDCQFKEMYRTYILLNTHLCLSGWAKTKLFEYFIIGDVFVWCVVCVCVFVTCKCVYRQQPVCLHLNPFLFIFDSRLHLLRR